MWGSQASGEAACHSLEVSPWTSHFSVISHVSCSEDMATSVIPQACPVWSAQGQPGLCLKKKREKAIGNTYQLQLSCENAGFQCDTGHALRGDGDLS